MLETLRAARRRVLRWADLRRPVVRDAGEYTVAGMATMPSRIGTFGDAFISIIRQVDRLYLYLDGHEQVPAIAAGHPKVVAFLARDYPGLHANGKLLGLVFEQRPCIYVCTDDDLHFRSDFVSKLRGKLAAYGDRAVVGLHGSTLAVPFVRYNKGRKSVSYTQGLPQDKIVDFVGSGAALFSSSTLRFDVRNWPYGNMTDMGLAIEAARAGIPMICMRRRAHAVYTIAINQADSLVVARKKDDTRQTELAKQLLQLRGKLAA